MIGGLAHRFGRWLGSEGLAFSERAGRAGFLPATPRGRGLWERYRLPTLAPSFSSRTWSEALGALDVLDRLPEGALEPLIRPGGAVRALDVGSKNWRYAPALASWLGRALAGRASGSIDGIEVDAHRWHLNLRSRASYGRFFAARVSEASRRGAFHASLSLGYHAADVRDWPGEADLVTWFFPFVLEEPHRAWGLPPSLFAPRECFEAVARRILRPGGRLVMFNQGEWEWKEAERLLQGLPLRLSFRETVEGSLHASRYPIFLTLWIREE